MILDDEYFMAHAITLAEKGIGMVSPNPLVGAVLVYNQRIIGEGYHMKYGEAHAEVNCINSVSEEDKHLIPLSKLYVTLEPCVHFGKTPPCADLIIKAGIKDVVIAALDPFEEVNGKGVEKLVHADIEVRTDVLQYEARFQNRRFFWFHENKQPYIILKWAQTADGFMASFDDERLLITGDLSNELVHQWRSEEDAIMIGARTALLDDPLLTVRHVPGKSPLRVIVSGEGEFPSSLRMFNDGNPVIIFNPYKEENVGNQHFKKVDYSSDPVEMMEILYNMNVQSLIVEGGPTLLQYFIDHYFWNEIRIITNTTLFIENGVPTPILPDEVDIVMDEMFENDRVIVII